MEPLKPEDLSTLEAHERERPEWRKRIIELRNARRIQLGPDMSGGFENRETVRWQIQEMLRVERIFEPAGVAHELETYNPLIPAKGALSLTLMVEIDDPERRSKALRELKGLESRVFVDVAGERVSAVSHLREDGSPKAPAVHFLTFPLSEEQRRKFAGDAPVSVIVDHGDYQAKTPIEGALRQTLREEIEE